MFFLIYTGTMYLAVDMGGTKVLMALFDKDSKLIASRKFATAKNYQQFLSDFQSEFNQLGAHDLRSAGIAVPAMLDRNKGVAVHFGNLDWENVPMLHDFSEIVKCPIILENDAKAGAVFQAENIKDEFSRMLYIAVGTGVGVAYTTNGILDTKHGDDGGKSIIINQADGSKISWDHLASGKAIFERFQKKASEITDPEVWKIIAHNLALGLEQILPIYRPEIIVFGGGVGAHLEHFQPFLLEELSRSLGHELAIPVIRKGVRAEEAVVYGCLELAKRIQ